MSGVSTIELLIRMTVSLAVIGGLLWLIQRVGRKRLGGLGRSATAPIEVTSRKQLSRTSSIALVRVGERNILIGVTDAGVSLIAEGDDLNNHPLSPSTSDRRTRRQRHDQETHAQAKHDNHGSESELLADLGIVAERPFAGAKPQSVTRTTNKTGLARKPGHGAKSSTHSGTRALDALREMTVRKA